MRILVLTFYFEPDLCAGSFRATAFVRELRKALPAGSRVDVVTTLPNRYHSFSADAPEKEIHEGLTVKRMRLPAHKSGMLDQAKAFRSYAWQVLKETRGRYYDLVYATSSRMFTGFLGALCARRMNAPLYLDIRDIFNDTIRDLLGRNLISLFFPALNLVERVTILSARKVNLVSEGFLEYFQVRYPRQCFSVSPNGIDEEFIGMDFSKQMGRRPANKKVVYAGNVGQGQGLHEIIPGLAKAVGPVGFEFEVIGDGGARALLEKAIHKAGVHNVHLRSPVSRDELIRHYRDADVLFLHLNDRPAFKKVLPSKIFEYAATGKPVLAGVSGFAADFLNKHVENAVVFHPCNIEAAKSALLSLRFSMSDRSDFTSHFHRRRLIQELVADVLSSVNVQVAQ